MSCTTGQETGQEQDGELLQQVLDRFEQHFQRLGGRIDAESEDVLREAQGRIRELLATYGAGAHEAWPGGVAAHPKRARPEDAPSDEGGDGDLEYDGGGDDANSAGA